jgi:Uma2 family endonuclease
VQALSQPLTLAEFLKLPETEPASEYIDGQIVQKPMPRKHSALPWNRIPRDRNGDIANIFEVAPDWTIEILSPDQSHTKVTKNILHCLKHGTQMGWPIDPDERTHFVYLPTQEIQVFDDPSVILPVPAFASQFQLSLGALLDWLK